MAANYLSSVNAVILVYDITHVGTFQNLEEWIKLIQKTFCGALALTEDQPLDRHDPRMPYIALIGNKGGSPETEV
jgi:GTPase SAR1 family protein